MCWKSWVFPEPPILTQVILCLWNMWWKERSGSVISDSWKRSGVSLRVVEVLDVTVRKGQKSRAAFQVVAGSIEELIFHSVWKVPELFLVWCESDKRGDNKRQLWDSTENTQSLWPLDHFCCSGCWSFPSHTPRLPMEVLLKTYLEKPAKFSWPAGRKGLYTLKRQNWKKIPSSSLILPGCIMDASLHRENITVW